MPKTAIVLVLSVLPGVLEAQSLTGSVTGTIRDGQGGVLPAVAMTLIGKTGPVSTATDERGEYRFPALDPGEYALTAVLAGFQGRRREGITVGVGGQIAVDLVLELAGRTTSLEVSGQAPVVDVTSSATANSLSPDLLFNMPLSRVAVFLLNATPGINNFSAFGAGVTGNAFLLDGVDSRDPLTGTDWNFFNYNVIEELKVQGPGAPAEYGAFTGAVVNTITRSGGNQLAGLFDILYTRQSFAGNNVTPEIAAQNPTLADPGSTRKLLDVTAQLSGPLAKDKLFFFLNLQSFTLNTDPSGPRTVRDEHSPRVNGKLNWHPSDKDHLMAMAQYDGYKVTGAPGVPIFLATDELTGDVDGPELIWNTQWRHIFGSRTFIEAKYVGWSSHEDFDPQVDKPLHLDAVTGRYSVSAGFSYHAERRRHQVNASLSHYADKFGKHDLKFGVEVERGRARDGFAFVDDIYYVDYEGLPYLAYSYSYDITARNERESVYAQDAWKASTRLSVNAGLRFDWIRGEGPEVGEVFDTKSLAPRLGLAFDVRGDQRSVLKASYGQYYEAALGTYYRRAIPGFSDTVIYENTGSDLVEIDRSPNVLYGIDPGVRHPRMDEFTVGMERALSADLRVSLTGIWREYKRFIDAAFPEARWTPTSVTNELTGQPLTVYRWANRPASQDSPLIRNVDGFRYQDPQGNEIGTARADRRYKGLMLVISKRLSARWQAQASYVLSKTEGTVDSTKEQSIGNSHKFESPTTALVNVNGLLRFDPRHEIKVLASYQVPKIELGVNVYFRSLSGQTYSPVQRLPARAIDYTFGRDVLLEPRGSRRVPAENALDLRIEKVFKPRGGRHRLGVYTDIRNAFNASTVLFVQTRVPSLLIEGVPTPVLFGAPVDILPARQVTLGTRWSF